ncbi:hypothetical protein [Mycolicibacterium psychrotolerans]|uniref:Uncharacterized protein n=1 Tax=Mycolicibacterium psychrotolerans TaxID=216929 RepID=A0A7I7M638_9MYCO|nr:hypothetical protein [Mycolicibacterium psychrotolerans]BBX67480.1 hypothetical protein MPSYJ_09410 [Mycolicibacterium psychrotolerans]
MHVEVWTEKDAIRGVISSVTIGETNHAEPFTPTAEQLRRIDENVRLGYER